MPERRQYQSNNVDRMLADFAVIVEDAEHVRLLSWNGNAWQDIATAQMRFRYSEGAAYLWLPLALLGVNPAAVDVSLVGFVSEEESLQIWATMPGNNPLNSPTMLPKHLPEALDVERTLVNLQTSMRLSADANVNNTLDNCPTNVLFDQSLLDVEFIADPAAEIYDPVVYEGVRAVVPDDVEALLGNLCAGVTDSSQSAVCELAQQVAENVGGGGPEAGPTGQLPASAGPGDQLTFYATVRNLSSQESGHLTLKVEGDLPSNGQTLTVGTLAPLESRVISFTETVDPSAAYTVTVMTIYPVEEVENTEDDIIVTYEHEPHTVIHDIDRSAPMDAELDERLLEDLIGTGEQLLEGIVFDQSPVAEITLQTSLGGSFTCDDTTQIDSFTSAWACAITLPENTPDGTQVQVSLSAKDVYGFASGVIAQWTFEVDNQAPTLSFLDEDQRASAAIGATTNTTETLLLEGLAADERWLAGVQVCDTLGGFESCQDAELIFFSDAITGTRIAVDQAQWSLERSIERGIAGATVPFTVTAYDAAGNGVQQRLTLLIDTLPPTVTLATQPVTQIDYDGTFALSGSATDQSGVDMMELEVIDPLGEYVYYPVTLAQPGATSTGWQYEPTPGSAEFATPGEYSYFILAYDALGNERESGPYTLTVSAPAQPWINAPTIVETSNDLWEGFAPGALVYMQVKFDDADLSLGDSITVTADPFPTWLTLKRLDTRTVEISGTVPLTITQVTIPDETPVDESEVITPMVQINVGLTLTDATGQQAYQSWVYEQVLSGPTKFYLPSIFHNSGQAETPTSDLFIYIPILNP